MNVPPRAPGKQKVRRRLIGLMVLFFVALTIVYAPILNAMIDGANLVTGLRLRHVERPFVLGLDLQSGSRLEYEADVSRIPEADRKEAVNGVSEVIERRVNTLGVSEPLIQTLRAGDAWRVNVELAGIRDVQEAITLIGETPILEFKEQNTDTPRSLTAAEEKLLAEKNAAEKARAESLLAQALKPGANFESLQKAETRPSSSPSTMEQEVGSGSSAVTFIQEAPVDVVDDVRDLPAGTVLKKLIDRARSFAVVMVDSVRDDKEVNANHLLVAFKGAEGELSTRSKDEARKKIETLRQQATPGNFVELTKTNSDEPGAAETSGALGWFKKGDMVEAFDAVVFPQIKGSISDVVESPFGFHLIYKQDERPLKTSLVRLIEIPKTRSTDLVPTPEPWKTTRLTGKQLQSARVEFDQNTGGIQVALQFNDEGGKLFADITKRNVGKPLAIFLDGRLVTDPPPTVQTEILGGQAVITGNYSLQEAKLMARRLQAGALPVPVKLIAQQTIGPTLGLDSLQKSLTAGIAGFILVALFMMVVYRLPGIVSVVALGLYAALSLAVFKILPVTLTLSGIAGFILSIGIAVDANVLTFERLKEEWRSGKGIGPALEDAFRRAWLSIRDGHATVLISCAVLYWFSSSVIKGFALTLGIGTLISLFTAVVSTRTILRFLATTRLGKAGWWFLKPTL